MAELYLLAINIIHQNIMLNMSYQNSRPAALSTMILIDKVLKAIQNISTPSFIIILITFLHYLSQ